MLRIRSFVFSVFLILGTVHGAQAGPIYLGLGMDASGSISAANFNLQRNAYINVLEALGALLEANEVWISINQFASTVRNELSLMPVTVAEVLPGGAIRTALEDMVKLGAGTNIGNSINDLTAQFLGADPDFFDLAIIDISTDGRGSLGTSVGDALAAGIDQINCLGVGTGANCDFIAGEGAFSIIVAGFADFEAALLQKIQAEIGDPDPAPVPAPATLALLGIGLFFLGAMRKRKGSFK